MIAHIGRHAHEGLSSVVRQGNASHLATEISTSREDVISLIGIPDRHLRSELETHATTLPFSRSYITISLSILPIL